MVRTQIYIPDDLHRDVTLLAHQEGVNFSHVMREGARMIVRKKQAKSRKKDWRKFIGAVKGGPADVASKIDYYLYGPGNPKWEKHW